MSHAEAAATMEEEVRRGWRDPELVPLFVSAIQGKLASQLATIDPSLGNMSIQLSR